MEKRGLAAAAIGWREQSPQLRFEQNEQAGRGGLGSSDCPRILSVKSALNANESELQVSENTNHGSQGILFDGVG
jgi:hypothetical protein